MRALWIIAALGCGGSTERGVADATPPEPEPATKSYELAESVDRSALGATCDLRTPCPTGSTCYGFRTVAPDIVGSRCVSLDEECTVVTCAAGRTCIVLASYPGDVTCQRK